jgi:hypothetical protein
MSALDLRRSVAHLALALAGLCSAAAAQAPLDLSGWTLFDPDNDWTVTHPTTTSVKMIEQVTSSSVHPGWVVSDFILGNTVTLEFDLSVAAGTGDDDPIGFGFAYLDGCHSWLLDWKKSAQSFNWGQPVVINDDLCEAGMKIKRINGAYSWDGLWGGQDGQGVSTLAGPVAGGWTAGTVYHFVMQLAPGHIVVTRDATPIFDVLDASFPGGAGKITAYSFSQNNLTLANVKSIVPTWTDVGFAKTGFAGQPVLTGIGDLTPSSANQLLLSSARPSSTVTLVVGVSALNASFKGGTMVPDPALLVTLATDPAGQLNLPFVWPTGIPAGLSFWFQDWIQDAAATHSLSASNGLKGVSG